MKIRDAHGIISRLVKYCEQNRKYFHELNIEEFKQFSERFEEDVVNIFNF